MSDKKIPYKTYFFKQIHEERERVSKELQELKELFQFRNLEALKIIRPNDYRLYIKLVNEILSLADFYLVNEAEALSEEENIFFSNNMN